MAFNASEEIQAMLGYNCTNYKKTPSVCQDIENNNNNNNLKDEKDISHEEETAIQYSSNSKGVFAQLLVTGAILLLATGGGMPIGYSAVMLPQLSENNNTIYVDRELGSWIASIHSLATPIGSLLSGPLLDTIGRRGSLQLSTIPLGVGWLVIGFSKNVTAILVGRAICGLSVGLMTVPAQVLLGETAEPRLRGFLVGGGFASYCFGILLVYALGASFNWNIVAFCGVILPVLAFVALCLVPESPAWLVRRKKIEKAKKALLWLRGGNADQMNMEITNLEVKIKADLADRSANTSLIQRISSSISMVCDPTVLKPLIIINVFNALQLISGTYIIIFYGVDMLKDIGGNNMNNYLAAVVLAIIRSIFALVSCVMLLKMGRRSIGMISAIGTALASLLLAGFKIATKEESSADAYVLAVCLMFYVSTNTVGLVTLPALMVGELLPLKARGIGGGCIFFLFNLSLFFVTKCFPLMNDIFGISGVFIIFGTSGLLLSIFIYIAVPETKDRTLQEIENYFAQSNFLWVTRKRTKRNIATNNV